MPALEEIFGDAQELAQLKKLLTALEKAGCADIVNIDFSVVNDMRYYNGIVFRGFVEGVPGGVLSGGQYDGLMTKMRRKGKAIGFAIYPDMLDRLEENRPEESVDAALIYSEDSELNALSAAVEQLIAGGMTVKVLPEGADTAGCKVIYRLEGNEVRENA